MSRTARFLVGGGIVLVAAGLALGLRAASESASEDEIWKQTKSDVFDESWDSVLADCDKLIAAYPSSASVPRYMYYRAKALQHMQGREEEALAAYTAFLQKYPSEPAMSEDAIIGRLNLAKSLWLAGKKDSLSILVKGLEEKGYPRIYAAVQISHLDNRPARSRALPVLKECATGEKDAEVRNECTLAILRIDPSALPAARQIPAASDQSTGKEPKLIRLEVRDRKTDKVTVAINLPIAFAQALLGSLSEFDRGQVAEEFKKRNIDLNNIWRSLKDLGPQTLLQIETDDANIRIWLE